MMHVDLLHPADQLVMIMQRIYSCGMTTTSGGNLSIRDENGDIWITPTGIDKGSLTREDIVRVSPSGETFGPHQPSVELPFHREIYRLRPDLRAILHAHPPTLVAFSLARRIPDIRLTPDVRRICGDVAMAAYDVPGSRQLGVNIARRFAEGYQTVVMENHGCVCGARDLFGAFMAFETLDFCGRMELYARKLDAPRPLTPEQLSRACGAEGLQADALPAAAASSRERALRRDLCGMIHRAYDQRLCTSAQGAFSQRLSGESFLMTPHRKDRRYLDVADLVRVENGRCEAGKTPAGPRRCTRRFTARIPTSRPSSSRTRPPSWPLRSRARRLIPASFRKAISSCATCAAFPMTPCWKTRRPWRPCSPPARRCCWWTTHAPWSPALPCWALLTAWRFWSTAPRPSWPRATSVRWS